MKKIINSAFVALAAVVLLMGCQNEGQKALSQIVGEWHYSGVEEGVQEDVWIAFSQDMTFELYQKVGDGAFRKYTGTYTFDGTLLDGVYSDKAPWKEAKTVTIDGDSLTAVGVKTGETITYVRKLVPATVRYHYSDALKSMPVSAEPWL